MPVGKEAMKKEIQDYFVEAVSEVVDGFQKLDAYEPDFLNALVGVRRPILPSRKKPAIPKNNELIMVSVEIAPGGGRGG